MTISGMFTLDLLISNNFSSMTFFCATPRSESKARVVKILTTQNSSQIISLAYLDDSANFNNKSIKMILMTHRPKQI